MQNLSLQMSQTANLKKAEATTVKNSTGADKANVAEQNSPFQMMLSKQVQTQRVPYKQATPQTAAKPTVKASADAQAKMALLHKNEAKVASDEAPADASLATLANTTAIDSTKLEINGLLNTKESEDTQAVNSLDANTMALNASALAQMMNVLPQENTKTASGTLVSGTGTSGTADSTVQNTLNLDTALSHAMSQAKNSNTPKNEAINLDAAGTTQKNQDNAFDSVLTNLAKPVVQDEASSAKLMLNGVKESLVKDAVNKEGVMPTVLQTAAQVSTTLPAEQLASANTINAYPGRTGWDQAISQKVVWMVGAGQQSATLTLNPPDLGPLQVVIHVNNDQADTTFISDNPEVRQALQDGMANLRDKMSESGVQLGQANVSSGQQSQQQFQQAMQSQKAAQTNNTSAEFIADKAVETQTLVRVANGLVDTFA